MNKKEKATEMSKWAENFRTEEVQVSLGGSTYVTLGNIILGKAARLDDVYPEFLKYYGPNVIIYLLDFFSDILHCGKSPKFSIKPKYWPF